MALLSQGYSFIAGVDEAGCGPLAGPDVAAAVLFPCAWLRTGLYGKLRGLNDSKQLTEEERERFYQVITTHPEMSTSSVLMTFFISKGREYTRES